MDSAQISAALGTLKIAADLTQLIRTSGLSLDKAEAKMKLADLTNALAELKMQLADVKALVLEKNSEISELKALLNLKKSVSYEDPYYWVTEEGKEKDGPYCQKCLDGDKKFIRLQGRKVQGVWECRECTNTFYDKTYVKPVREPRVARGVSSWLAR